jgi:hypothetical protein
VTTTGGEGLRSPLIASPRKPRFKIQMIQIIEGLDYPFGMFIL